MTPEMAGTTVIIISLIITIILVFAQCKSAKKGFKWHSDMLIGFKDDEIKALKEKISRLESQIAVKDTIISELGHLNNQNTEKLWNWACLIILMKH